jgi:hypothetical protein
MQHDFNFNGNALVSGLMCNNIHVADNVPVAAYGVDLEGNVVEGIGYLYVLIAGCEWYGVWERVGADVEVALVSPIATSGTAHCVFIPGAAAPPVDTYSASCIAKITSTQ